MKVNYDYKTGETEIGEFTQEELQQIKEENDKLRKQRKIVELKQKLFDTDYQAIKYAEGQLSKEEYEPMKLQRKEWRNRINEIEAQLEV